MIKHVDSHLGHALTEAQVNYITERFKDRDGFFIETFELPETLGTVPCGLHGPLMGDAPIFDKNVDTGEGEAFYRVRGTRAYESRLVERAPRQVRTVTVIAGPHETPCTGKGPLGPCFRGQIECLGMHPSYGTHMETCGQCNGTGKETFSCILYTAFGGPRAPREPGELKGDIESVRRDAKIDDLVRAEKLGKLEQNLIESTSFWQQHALGV